MLVSVIIPSYNRYDYLVNAIQSVKNQTYQDVEIIVINDGSTDMRYYDKIPDVNIIHLKKNSQQVLGFKCGALARNVGLRMSKGYWIAFLDDDDIWMPSKLEIQIQRMLDKKINFSFTDGYLGNGFYDSQKKYPEYNSEYYLESLRHKLELVKFPELVNLFLIEKHNFIITSSVVVRRDYVEKVGFMKLIPNGGMVWKGKKEWQDWDYWKRILTLTPGLYLSEHLFYYDLKKSLG